MPELPEVETIRRDLLKSVVGALVTKIQIRDERVVRQPVSVFVQALEGRKVQDVVRRGKALLLDMEGVWLVVQPMMTGQLVFALSSQKAVIVKETKVIFELSKGKLLLYNDQRLFGRLQVVARLEDIPYFKNIGPEPLESSFTAKVLERSLKGRKAAIKPFLLDHRVVAGIGNIYASEVLFRSGISPLRSAGDLKTSEVERLCQAIKAVLRQAIKMRGTSMRNYRDGHGNEGRYLQIIKVYGRAGQVCRSCSGVVQSVVQSQRSTFFCPHCQK